jgi:hypothetical protein
VELVLAPEDVVSPERIQQSLANVIYPAKLTETVAVISKISAILAMDAVLLHIITSGRVSAMLIAHPMATAAMTTTLCASQVYNLIYRVLYMRHQLSDHQLYTKLC